MATGDSISWPKPVLLMLPSRNCKMNLRLPVMMQVVIWVIFRWYVEYNKIKTRTANWKSIDQFYR